MNNVQRHIADAEPISTPSNDLIFYDFMIRNWGQGVGNCQQHIAFRVDIVAWTERKQELNRKRTQPTFPTIQYSEALIQHGCIYVDLDSPNQSSIHCRSTF